MRIVLPEDSLPAKLELNPEWQMSDDDFLAFCMANPDLRLERNAQGEILILAPVGLESD
jgi:Uma2 family endonuclease